MRSDIHSRGLTLFFAKWRLRRPVLLWRALLQEERHPRNKSVAVGRDGLLLTQ
jgi:hypothetical protein